MEIQGKTTLSTGLKKSVHKTILKDGEYHHLKNGIVSSFEGDIPFVQNAPSNLHCLDLPENFYFIGSEFVKEKDFHIIFLVNPTNNQSEIGLFYGNECKYVPKINNNCLGFKLSHPIKAKYQFINCELNIYFQDGLNKDRHINLDNPKYKKIINENNCLVDTNVLDCESINIQNDLKPPVVKPLLPIESGALYSGVYQFAISYANINGDEQSSYYSKTNPLPIYEDKFGGWSNIEGSMPNRLTNKAIPLEFSNIDTRYDYFNLVVIKTIQGTPTYELVATLPTTTTNYLYTGRETTRLSSVDKLFGLYPDYFNSKTITNANNYLIRANMSTQDEINYQPIANLIELEWVVTRKQADVFNTSYKNPLMSVETKGYQRGETYAFGIQFLLKNGKKSSVFHIPGREANTNDLYLYTINNIPEEEKDNFYELFTQENCNNQVETELPKWKIYDTATITHQIDESTIDECFDGVVAYGDFAYNESTDTYPCVEEVWKNLTGKPIRHHKFPTNCTIHHHNSPYQKPDINLSSSDKDKIAQDLFEINDVYIYPIGVRLKDNLDNYLIQALRLRLITSEEYDLIEGYEIVRGDRTGNKSIIAKGLMYNMKYYTDINPATNQSLQILYPNYPFNDLNADWYLSNTTSAIVKYTYSSIDGYPSTLVPGGTINSGDYTNPYSTFTLPNPLFDSGSIPFINLNDPDLQTTFTFTAVTYSIVTYSNKLVISFTGLAAANLPATTITIENIINSFIPNISNNYFNDKFTFHSPDTHFKQPFLGSEINTYSVEYGVAKGRFESVEGHPKFRSSNKDASSVNMALAFKAVGDYNNYEKSQLKDFRRGLNDSGYLVTGEFVKLPNTTASINNRFRESSVGLRLTNTLSEPDWNNGVRDNSRYTVRQEFPASNGACDCSIFTSDRLLNKKDAFEIDSQCTEKNKWISSYYSALKVKIPNQYGQINTIKYVLTGQYFNKKDKPTMIFGGDTFITRFSLKRKHGFFRVNFIDQLPVGVTYKPDKGYANILNPNYYVSNEKGGSLGEYKIDWSESEMDCSIKIKDRNGYFYLYSTGVVHFFVESDINTELRYSGANPQDTFYPKLKNERSVWSWLEEKRVPIVLDNKYLYNFDYSKQNTEEALFTQALDFKPNSQCKNTHPRRIIYSKQNSQEASSDNWLIYPANQYYDIDTYMGDIIDVESLDTYKVLVRCENGSMVFNAFDSLQLDQTTVTLGTGGMFEQRPQTFAETDTGYGGSQSKWAFNNTQHGCFYLDMKRSKVFQYFQQLSEISTEGMQDWFSENLKLKILKDFPDINIDNPFYNVGYTSGFDTRFNLWFLTKKDYRLKNKKELKNISFNKEGLMLYKKQIINFNDEKLFENVGWTISYSPLYKAWISFHSFNPNFYITDIDKFFTGIQDEKIYQHWDKFTFQTYYDKLCPFEVQITTSREQEVHFLKSIEYNLKIQKYLNGHYQELYENKNINFNKLIVSTDNQSSGILNLIKKENSNPFQSVQYPKINSDSLDIMYSKVEGHQYRINQFADLVLNKNNNVPIFIYSDNGVDRFVNNIEYNKILNLQLENQKFRNEFFDITLINDKESDYKFILKLLLNKTLKSIR